MNVGIEAFFWDGEMHILPLPAQPQVMKVNNHGVVMITNGYGQTYLWEAQLGLRTIDNFMGLTLNDSSTLLGQSLIGDRYVYGIWKNDIVISWKICLA